MFKMNKQGSTRA